MGSKRNGISTDYLSEIGSSIGMAVTKTLYVSPNGNNTIGINWDTAFTTIQGALAVASTDADDCTLILISPHTRILFQVA